MRARKYVVLSSGTLGTPQILERSGVGDSKLLKQLDIKCVSDLPGVGEQYQDHYTTLSRTFSAFHFHICVLIVSVYRVSNESVTLDDFLRGDKETQERVCT